MASLGVGILTAGGVPRLSTTQINTPAVHVSLLNVLDKMLSDRLIFKRHKAKPSTRICIQVLYNLDLLNRAKLREEAGQLILRQVVIKSAHENLVAGAPRRLSARPLRTLIITRLRLLLALAAALPISATAPGAAIASA